MQPADPRHIVALCASRFAVAAVDVIFDLFGNVIPSENIDFVAADIARAENRLIH